MFDVLIKKTKKKRMRKTKTVPKHGQRSPILYTNSIVYEINIVNKLM